MFRGLRGFKGPSALVKGSVPRGLRVGEFGLRKN